MLKFEDILTSVSSLPRGSGDDDRRVHWFDSAPRIGVARQLNGRLEIFIVGEAIATKSPLVQRHLRFDSWSSQNGMLFLANRVVLPSDDHFVASAAFLVEELLRNGILNNAQHAFGKCEPILELFLRRSALDEQTIQGLYAELLVLEVGLQVADSSEAAATIVQGWKGWGPASRDFNYKDIALEVKSTGGPLSRHVISSLEQVNCKLSAEGKPLERLLLISVGLHASGAGHGRTLPQLVSSVIERIEQLSGVGAPTAQELLDRIARYGATESQGYIHQEMKDWSAYSMEYSRTFLRIYDMNDPLIKVLRFEDVADRIHSPMTSISFEVDLPKKIDGDLNPSLDLRRLMQEAL